MSNPSKLFITLETLAETLYEKANTSNTKAGKLAYEDAALLLLNQIQRIKDEIERKEELTLVKQMEKFDVNHSDYKTIFERGHVGIPNETHDELSLFTLDIKTASDVFDNLSEDFKYDVLSNLTSNKEMIEQLAATRHNFHYITHRTGHDGITPENKVYEVKNKAYTESEGRMNPAIIFDRVSPANLRKLDEGRPEIIFNVTDKHKVLVEMRIEFSDHLIELYRKQVERLKYSKTSGMSISFSDYKDSIIDITFVHPHLFDYHIHKSFLKFVKEWQSKDTIINK